MSCRAKGIEFSKNLTASGEKETGLGGANGGGGGENYLFRSWLETVDILDNVQHNAQHKPRNYEFWDWA